MSDIEMAEALGHRESHRHDSISDALAVLENESRVSPDEREAFLCGFYRERVVMHALRIRVLSSTASVSLEQLVKASVELSEIAARLEGSNNGISTSKT